MKLDFDIKTKGANLDFDMKDTKVISQSAKKEIVFVDIEKMMVEQDVTFFMDLSRRYASGEIVIVGSLFGQTAVVNAVDIREGEKSNWSAVAGQWLNHIIEGGGFDPFITVFGFECDGEKIVGNSGVIENTDLSDYVKFENRDIFVKEGLTETEETWTDEEKLSAQKLLGVDNRFNIINAILSQSGIVKKYKQPITQEYTERVTANGANVFDGSKAILEKVVGNTVKCENLLNIEIASINNGADYEKDGNAITYRGNVGSSALSYDTGQIQMPYLNTQLINTTGILVQKDKVYTILFDYLLKEQGVYGNNIGIFIYNSSIRLVKSFSNVSGTVGKSVSQKLTFTATENDKICITFRVNNNYVTLSNIQVREGDYTNTELPPYQPYFTGLKSATFSGIESKNADGTETSTLAFPKKEMPLGTTIDFEQKKIVDYGVEIVLNGEEHWTVSTGYTVNNTYYSSMYAKCLTSIENRPFGIATDGTVRIGQSGVYGHGVWWIGTGGLYLYLLGAEQYFNFTQFADPNNPTDEERENLKTEWKAYLAQRYADGNPVTIRYVSSVLQSGTPFTEEQSASGNEYIAYKGGTEKVLDNDGEEYGADNTLTQDYILVAEVD